MKVLITGGVGFIGSNIAIHLKNQGYDVIVFDNLKRAKLSTLEKINLYKIPIIIGDVLNTKKLRKALTDVDIVIHAAAYISVEESVKKPTLYFKNNVVGTVNVANICLNKNIKLIYISSAAVYGNPINLPINENHPTNPISPYGLSKLMGEEVIKFYGKYGLKYVILRLFNVYGLGQSNTYSGVINCFIQRLKEGKPPIIYGDGLQTRDFIHVNDVAEAIKLSIEKEIENEIINIATGKPITIRELAKLIINYSNKNLKPIFVKPRSSDIKHSYADISKANKLLNFNPRISLEQGLKELLQLS
ncbi:MAG: NAD-dependent epimerase/dehydratase family protein [Candidatus Methanomethylicaceae archaeon]